MITDDFHALIDSMAETGTAMTQLNAAEGAAGNLSIFVRDLQGVPGGFKRQEDLHLPVNVPSLAGGWILVTASGQRLRDLGTCPQGTLCVLRILPGGECAELYCGEPRCPTIEFNSHLAIHQDHVNRRNLDYHAIVHVQPLHLVFLSHIERYHDPTFLNRRLMRWQVETIAMLPEGIGILSLHFPGAKDQVKPSVASLQTHRLTLWSQHGTLSRSDESVQKAGDLVEYAECAARYEVLNLQAGEPAAGLSDETLRRFCVQFGIHQNYF